MQATEQADAEAVAAPEPMVGVPEGYFQATEAELEARPQFFKPLEVKRKLRVQPLLTPDNYADKVLQFINTGIGASIFRINRLRCQPLGRTLPTTSNC